MSYRDDIISWRLRAATRYALLRVTLYGEGLVVPAGLQQYTLKVELSEGENKLS